MRLEIVDSGPGISTVRTVRYPKCILYFFILHCTIYIFITHINTYSIIYLVSFLFLGPPKIVLLYDNSSSLTLYSFVLNILYVRCWLQIGGDISFRSTRNSRTPGEHRELKLDQLSSLGLWSKLLFPYSYYKYLLLVYEMNDSYSFPAKILDTHHCNIYTSLF